MTREEAKKEATTTIYNLVYDGNSSLNNPRFSLIDKIYDDFESRTCENCKWYQTHTYHASIKTDATSQVLTRCQKFHINWGEDFGCNKFESKDTQ